MLTLVVMPGLAHAAPGDLDPSFAGKGVLTPGIFPENLALQDDGRILIGGTALHPRRLVVARHLPGGEADRSFGDGGVATIPDPSALGLGFVDQGLVTLDDGSFIAAAMNGNGDPPSKWALARFGPDGAVDQSFGTAGVSVTAMPSGLFEAITVDEEGRILGVGSSNGNAQTIVARFDRSGNLDPTFADDGVMTLDMQTATQVVSLAGQIFVAGHAAFDAPEYRDVAVARLTADGDLDPSFGDNGYAAADSGSGIYVDTNSLLAGPDGRTFVGVHGCAGQFHPPPTFICRSAVVAFTGLGQPDGGFGDQGRVSNVGSYLAPGPDGSIFVGGDLSPGRGYPAAASVTNVAANGQLTGYARGGSAFAYGADPAGEDAISSFLVDPSSGNLVGTSAENVIRFQSSGAGMNADADALDDADDRCELFYALNKTGCPDVARFAGISARKGRLKVRLQATVPGCLLGVPIKVFRARDGRDRLIDRLRTSTKRPHVAPTEVSRPGKYYAIAPAKFKFHFGHCERVRTQPVGAAL
jgi:uncharacterized delta-60 repeat protein